MLNVKSKNQTQSSHTKKPYNLLQVKCVLLNHQTSTTESISKLAHSVMNSLMQLKRMKLLPSKIKKKETENLPTNSDGISMMPKRSGASDLKLQDQTFLLIKLKPSNISMKSRTQWKLPSNGPLKKES